jgi:hypothetical protein
VAMRRRRDKIVVTAETEPISDQETDAALSARARMGSATDQALATIATSVLPALMEARERLTPVAEQAMAQGKIRGKQAAAIGLNKSREAAIRWGVLEEPKKKESHWIRNLLIMLGLGAAGGAAYKMLTGKDADPSWTAGRDAAAPTSSFAVAEPGDPGDDSVPWGDTPTDQMDGMDPSAVDPILAEPAGSDPIDGRTTAPTAPLASEESVESSVPTTPGDPVEHHDLT